MKSSLPSQVILRQSSYVPIERYTFEKHFFKKKHLENKNKKHFGVCLYVTGLLYKRGHEFKSLPGLRGCNWWAPNVFCLPYCVSEKYAYVVHI